MVVRGRGENDEVMAVKIKVVGDQVPKNQMTKGTNLAKCSTLKVEHFLNHPPVVNQIQIPKERVPFAENNTPTLQSKKIYMSDHARKIDAVSELPNTSTCISFGKLLRGDSIDKKNI